MITKRIDFNYRPLRLSVSMGVVGAVPEKQSYNSVTGVSTPDYTLTPLVIQPIVNMIDMDEVLPSGKANNSLTNIKWYTVAGGVRTEILSTNTKFDIASSGDDAGRLMLKDNLQSFNTDILELLFTAEFVDTRAREVYKVMQMFRVYRDYEKQEEPLISMPWFGDVFLDPESLIFAFENSFEVSSSYFGTTEKVDKYKLEAWDEEQGVWSVQAVADSYNITNAAGQDVIPPNGDYFPADEARYMLIWGGTNLSNKTFRLRLRVAFVGHIYGGEEEWATTEFALIPKRDKYEFDISDIPNQIAPDTEFIFPRVRLTYGSNAKLMGKGDMLGYTAFFPVWYIATNNASTGLVYTQVAEGWEPKIPASLIDPSKGAVLALDVIDRGHYMIAGDENDSPFVDENGIPFKFI